MEGLQDKIDKFIEDYDFESGLKDKRHKEMRKDLSDIIKALNTPMPIELPESEPLDFSPLEQKIEQLIQATNEVPKSTSMLAGVLRDTIQEQKYQPVRDWTFTLDKLNGDPKGPIVGGRFFETKQS